MKHAIEHQFGPIKSLQMGVGYFGPPPVQVYAYLVDGLLIDTGPPKLAKQMVAWLEQQTFHQLFVTHHHEDHSGNVNAIQNQFNNKSFASYKCAQLVKNKIYTSISQKLFWGTPTRITSLIPWEKSTFSTEHHQLTLIPVPGHSEDQMALYVADEGWLFSADVFVSPVIKYFLSNERMDQQIQSLKRLEALEFDQLFCAHTPLQKGGKDALRQKRNYLESYYQAVVYYHHKGQSPRQILSSIEQKERWSQYFISAGHMSAINMVRAVLRDEHEKNS